MAILRPRPDNGISTFLKAQEIGAKIAPDYKPAFINFVMLILEAQLIQAAQPMSREQAAAYEAAATAGDGARALGVILDQLKAAAIAEGAATMPEAAESTAETAEQARAALYSAFAPLAGDILTGIVNTEQAIAAARAAQIEFCKAAAQAAAEKTKRLAEYARSHPIQIIEEIENATTPEAKAQKIRELQDNIDGNIIAEDMREWYEDYCTTAAAEEIQIHPEQAAFLMSCVKLKSTALTTISHDPTIRAMTRGETGEVFRSTNPETREVAIYKVLSGSLTLEEKAALIAIKDFKDAGNITPKGFIYFSLGQMYRARRGQKATGGAQKEQKEAELQILLKMAETWHKYEVNEPMKIWGGFEAKRGSIKLIGFDIHEGMINGKEDDLIVLHSTPLLIDLLDRLRFCETVDREVKEIKQYKYTLALKAPIEINGKTAQRRSFASNEQRRTFCEKYGITKDDIADYGETMKIWPQTGGRIALREALTEFVFDYINARGANARISNKKRYQDIFEQCGINTANRAAVKRAKEDIAVILTYWSISDIVPWLKGWKEYKNKRSTKADGIEIFLNKAGELETGAK